MAHSQANLSQPNAPGTFKPDATLPDGLAYPLWAFYPAEYKLLELGRRFVRELRERSIYRPRELDADGEPVRTVLGDGLARDGFHALHDYAAELGVLPTADD
jgi:hypothetical protein